MRIEDEQVDLEAIKAKLILTNTWGSLVCSFCRAKEYPVDENGINIDGIDLEEAGYALDHEKWCVILDIEKMMTNRNP